MNSENYEEGPKMVSISQEILVEILEENKSLKTKINDLENVIKSVNTKYQQERMRNQNLEKVI